MGVDVERCDALGRISGLTLRAFLVRWFTPRERERYGTEPDLARAAVRGIAAKEAVWKALGDPALTIADIEVLDDDRVLVPGHAEPVELACAVAENAVVAVAVVWRDSGARPPLALARRLAGALAPHAAMPHPPHDRRSERDEYEQHAGDDRVEDGALL